ncbi:MAG: ParA family protein, partial [Planctomycetota bacterium]
MTLSRSPHSGAKMQVLTFVNQKGGCGKTTTAINLAGALVRRGQRVLVVDLDPQAHATMGLGVDGSEGASVAEVLLDEAYIEQAIRELPSGLHLLPSRPRLGEFEERSERLLHPEQRLRFALDAVRDRYDYVVVDCPPRADGVLCANAMFACTLAML